MSQTRRTWIREFMAFGSTTALDQAARLGANLAVASIVGPTTWGIWFLLNLVIQYGSLAHLGTLNGMNREIPAAIGRGDEPAATAIRSTALGTLMMAYAIGLSLLITAVSVFFWDGPTDLLALTATLLVAQQLYTFALVDLRSRTRFGLASRMQLVSAISYPLLTVLGAIAGDLAGFLLAQIVSYVMLCAIAARQTAGLFRPRFDLREGRRLIRIGLPIMLVGVSTALFSTVDRWIVQGNLGAEALGQYAIAVMIVSAIRLLPQVIAQQVYPRLAMAWSAHGTWGALEPLIARQRWTSLAVIVPTTVAVVAVVPWGIRTFLPAYVDAIPPMFVAMAIPLVTVIGQGYGNAFNVVGLQHWNLAIIAVATAATVITSLALVDGYELAGVAAGNVVGFTVMSIATVAAGAVARKRASLARNP